jgi:hypothetical protein
MVLTRVVGPRHYAKVIFAVSAKRTVFEGVFDNAKRRGMPVDRLHRPSRTKYAAHPLRRRLTNEVLKPEQAGYSRSCGGREADVFDFHFGLFFQPGLVSLHAGRRAESHLKVRRVLRPSVPRQWSQWIVMSVVSLNRPAERSFRNSFRWRTGSS